MAHSALVVESFTFNAPPGLDGQSPSKLAAKRYTDKRESNDGLTVLLAHGTGTSKFYQQAISVYCFPSMCVHDR